MDDFPYLYRGSYGEAVRCGMEKQYDASFRENVICARAIEQAIRDHWDEASEGLAEGCAQSVLERYGFKRVNFVLANSLQELKKSACDYLVSDETYQWGRCQRQFEIVRKRRRNFVVFRRGGNKTKRFLAQKECSRFAVSDA